MLLDKNEKLLKDNDERMIFFTKGVIETVKKLNWSPDIIHLNGWFTSLFPLYMKTIYADDPIFLIVKLFHQFIQSRLKDVYLNRLLKSNLMGLKRILKYSDPDYLI